MTPRVKKRLVLQLDDDYHDIVSGSSSRLPSVKQADEDRNKVIPNQIMATIRDVFQQKKLSNFMEANAVRELRQQQEAVVRQEQAAREESSSQKVLAEAAASGAEARQPDASEQEVSAQAAQEKQDEVPIEKILGTTAVHISRIVRANCIVTVEKGDSEAGEFGFKDVRVIVYRKAVSGKHDRNTYNTKMRQQQPGSILPIRELLMEAVSKRFINKGDKIVFIGSGENISTGLKAFFFLFDIDKVFFNISTMQLSDSVNGDVLEAVINIAQEIGREGKEGHSVGTAFIIGRREDVSGHYRPLNKFDPFANAPEDQRRITDPEIKETVKNYAQLDGAYLIDATGAIITAGAYLNVEQKEMDLPGLQGLGTRHRSAAAFTKMTNSVAVVVSAGGGIVRVFKDGRQIMRLP